MVKNASPKDILHCLKGSHYPSNKEDLVSLARKNRANNSILNILDALPNKEYTSSAELVKAVGKIE